MRRYVISDTGRHSGVSTMRHATPKADLCVQKAGSVFLLRAISDRGSGWIIENILNGVTTLGGAVPVEEHRIIDDIVAGAKADGLTVE
jgi:hypothetical protein